MTSALGGDVRRSLSNREAEILDFMLAVDDPRLEPLRRQARVVTVSWECTCGCATINLDVDRDHGSPAPGLCFDAVYAARQAPIDSDDFCELILFVEHGWLASLELVWYTNPIPEFPPAREFEPARLRC